MKKAKLFNFWLVLGMVFCHFCFCAFAQQNEASNDPAAVLQAEDPKPQNDPEGAKREPFAEPETKDLPFAAESLSASENVTLDFKEADIQNVLKIISYKSGVNIVSTPDVIGNVTIKLVDVPWQTALDVLLKTYGFGYQRQGNIILVTKLENISKIQAEESLQTEIFILKFLDAQDAQKILIPLLSPRGKISVLYTRGMKGWQFGSFKIGKEMTSGAGLSKEKDDAARAETISIERTSTGETVSRKADFEPSIKSKVLIVSDTAASLDRIRNVILPMVDKRPQQVLIEARLMEVNRNKLRDLGVDFGTGSTGAESSTIVFAPAGKKDGIDTSQIGGHLLGSQFKPSVFNALEGSTLVPGVEPFNLGGQFVFRKLTGTNFEVLLHALEEDAHTNTLSSPRILTLDNQEASILVGFHTPILTSTVTAGTTTGTGATVTQTLDYYQEIGIRLNVVPQVSEEGFINMIIHPSVTSTTSNVTATSTAGDVTTNTSYPIIDVREAQTQVLLKDGETIVIGGLLKDVKSKQTVGVPFLSAIPFIGGLFRRDTYDTEKVDLLIFITARIIKDGEFSAGEISKLEKGMDTLGEEARQKAVSGARKKKKE